MKSLQPGHLACEAIFRHSSVVLCTDDPIIQYFLAVWGTCDHRFVFSHKYTFI